MTIAKPSRLRRILKWSGVGVCAVIVTAWAVSLCWSIYYVHLGRERVMVAIRSGLFAVWLGPGRNVEPGFRYEDASGDLGLVLPRRVEFLSDQFIFIPLWLLLIIAAAPTACLFWRDHRLRIPPGHCQTCGYNLTANTSGICPECGTALKPSTGNTEQDSL